MNKPELDGIPLSDKEISLIRMERECVRRALEKQLQQKYCDHDFSKYVGHSHNDDVYECVKCGKTKYV